MTKTKTTEFRKSIPRRPFMLAHEAHARAALRRAVERIAASPTPNTLCRQITAMGRFIAYKSLPSSVIVRALTDAAIANGLDRGGVYHLNKLMATEIRNHIKGRAYYSSRFVEMVVRRAEVGDDQ